MTDSVPTEAGNAGQLSPDGNWVWDGTAWEPTVSPDGRWRWDGHAWQAFTSEAQSATAASAQKPGKHWFPQVSEIDNPGQYASGSLPPKVDELPSEPLFRVHGLAIGEGWVARRPMRSWHLLGLAQLRSIAIVPPTSFTESEYSRSIVAPSPDVVLQDRSGSSIRVSAWKLDPAGRRALASQLPPTAEVTPAAGEFLRSGNLPGDWGKHLQFFGKRFG